MAMFEGVGNETGIRPISVLKRETTDSSYQASNRRLLNRCRNVVLYSVYVDIFFP